MPGEDPTSVNAAAVECPVCLEVAPPAQDGRCIRCRRLPLTGPAFRGNPTAAELDEHRLAVDAAGREFDIAAARRAAGHPRAFDLTLFDFALGLVRGDSVTPAERDALLGELGVAGRTGPAGPHAGGPSADDIAAKALPAVERLVDGQRDLVTFIDLGPDAVRRHRLVADDIGTPVPDPAGSGAPVRSWIWEMLIPDLDPDPERRRFQLAGGVGTLRTTIPRQATDESFRGPVADEILGGDGAGGELVVLWRTESWRFVEALGDVLRTRCPGRVVDVDVDDDPGAPSLEDVVDAVVRRAPLRHAYHLVLADLGGPDPRHTTVTLRRRRLFDAGTRAAPAPPPEVSIPVHAPPVVAGSLLLAVVANPHDRTDDPTDPYGRTDPPGGGEPHRRWRGVAMGTLDLPAHASTTVTVALDGPGRVRFTAPRVGTAAVEWDDLARNIPATIDTSSHPLVDVVCAVELGGDPGAADARLALVRRFVELLTRTVPDPRAVLVGLVGYADRDPRLPDVVPVRPDHHLPCGLPEDALAALGRWAPTGYGHDWAAPVEEALARLAAARWRAGAARVLITLGERPPHPRPGRHGHPTLPRPANTPDWDDSLRGLKGGQHVRCVAVTGLSAGRRSAVESNELYRDRRDRAWQELGSAARLRLGGVDADQLAAAAGIATTRPGAALLPVPVLRPLSEEDMVGRAR